jgi:hypothetical protein
LLVAALFVVGASSTTVFFAAAFRFGGPASDSLLLFVFDARLRVFGTGTASSFFGSSSDDDFLTAFGAMMLERNKRTEKVLLLWKGLTWGIDSKAWLRAGSNERQLIQQQQEISQDIRLGVCFRMVLGECFCAATYPLCKPTAKKDRRLISLARCVFCR